MKHFGRHPAVVFLCFTVSGALAGTAGFSFLTESGWAPLPPNVLEPSALNRFGCVSREPWASFRKKLVETRLRGGRLLTDELLLQAEDLLETFGSGPEMLRSMGLDFHSAITSRPRLGQNRSGVGADLPCLAGLQAACFIRSLGLVKDTKKAHRSGQLEQASAARHAAKANAKLCGWSLGTDASLDFLVALGWPISALDFELYMSPSSLRARDPCFLSPAAASRGDCNEEEDDVEVFSDVAKLLGRQQRKAGASQPPHERPRALSESSVDPQMVQSWSLFQDPLGRRGLRLPSATAPAVRRISIASVSGGHCSLWAELAFTLERLFPEHVETKLLTYEAPGACSDIIGTRKQVHYRILYFDGDPIIRRSDVLVCHWIGECAKLRQLYSKPVIAYPGHLPLNDPSVGSYHYWSEELPRFWERVEMMLDCDVHGGGRGWRRGVQRGKLPLDLGPPCAVVWEEPQLAAAAEWQFGAQLPSVKPMAFYVGVQHNPALASDRVLVINKYRLHLDDTFVPMIRHLRHPRYPYEFVAQSGRIEFSEMASHRAAVLLPWDLNLVMFHDLYAMYLPLFLPDRAGLHHTAFSYFKRFQEAQSSEKSGNSIPWAERMPHGEKGELPPTCHPYSPFDLLLVEAQDYWLQFTEYVRVPHVKHFAGIPDLLVQVLELETHAVSAAMRAEHERSAQEAKVFWGHVLGTFQQQALFSHPRPRSQLHFTTPWGKDLCWKQGLSQELCCGNGTEESGSRDCFDDFWTFQRCCSGPIVLGPIEDSACSEPVSDKDAPRKSLGPLSSVLDGTIWRQFEPSREEPFVFLWDEKTGGSSFMASLKYSVLKLGKMEKSWLYSTPGHVDAIGSHFFLKSISPSKARSLEVLAGQVDWRLLHEGVQCRHRKQIRCFMLLRHPVDRFVSYYLQRSDRRFEREVAGNRTMDQWTLAELRSYLRSVSREKLWFNGEEPGLFYNQENFLSLDLAKTASDALPELRRVRRSGTGVRERNGFRFLGGPQNRLAWLLDPVRGSPRLAVWRLRHCLVAFQTEDYDGYRRLLGWHFPWLNEVRSPRTGEEKSGGSTSGWQKPKATSVRSKLSPAARRLIERYNWRDMIIYRAAKRQYRRQLRRLEEALADDPPQYPQIVEVSKEEIAAKAGEALQHTETHRVSKALTAYMLGLPMPG